MILKGLDIIKKEDGSVDGIPAAGGFITLIEIGDIVGDEPDEETGTKTLVYNPDGTIGRNYMLAYVVDNGEEADENLRYTVMVIGNGKTICNALSIGEKAEEYGEKLDTFIESLDCRVASGSPIYVDTFDLELPTGVADDGTETYEDQGKAYFVFNKLDAYKEIVDEETNDFMATLKSTYPDDTDEELMEKAYELTSYAKFVKNNPGIEEQCDRHVMVKGFLAKVAEMIQRVYNKANYEDKVDILAKYIGEMRIFDDNGDISPLTVSSLDNLFTAIKNKIYIH